MLYFYNLRQNSSTAATRSAGFSWWATSKTAVPLLGKCCTSLTTAAAGAAQPSGGAWGRQRYPSTQKASFTNQIMTACLLQGKGRKKHSNILHTKFNTHAT